MSQISAATTMCELEAEYAAIIDELEGDEAGKARANAYLAGTKAAHHGTPAIWKLPPCVLDAATMAALREDAETLGSIMDKVTRAFRQRGDVRTWFGMSEGLERLACLDTGYELQVPLARADVSMGRDGSYALRAVSCEGYSGMVCADEVSHATRLTLSYHTFSERHAGLGSFELSAAWTRTLIDLYHGWYGPGFPDTNPGDDYTYGDETMSLAIVDYAESIDLDDVEHFVAHMRDRGVHARFADVRDLRLVEVKPGRVRLMDNDGPIACVWRRASAAELMARPCEGTEALIHAAEQNIACVVGSFRVAPCCEPEFLTLLTSELAPELLDARELAFVRNHVGAAQEGEGGVRLSLYIMAGELAGIRARTLTPEGAINKACFYVA